MAIALQIFIVLHPLRYMVCIVSFALGCFLFAITLVNELIDDITAANDDIKKSKSKVDLVKKFSELINLHSDGKQFSGTANMKIVNL